jgi:hypothetical protein
MSEPGLIWTRKRTSIKSFGPSFNIYFKGPVDAGELKNLELGAVFASPDLRSTQHRESP